MASAMLRYRLRDRGFTLSVAHSPFRQDASRSFRDESRFSRKPPLIARIPISASFAIFIDTLGIRATNGRRLARRSLNDDRFQAGRVNAVADCVVYSDQFSLSLLSSVAPPLRYPRVTYTWNYCFNKIQSFVRLWDKARTSRPKVLPGR